MTPEELDRIRHLYGEYINLRDKIFELQDRLEGIKAEFRKLGRGTHELGGGALITISPNHRFDEDEALRAIPEPLIAYVTKHVPAHDRIDKFACKRELPPALYERCMVPQGEDRVNVK